MLMKHLPKITLLLGLAIAIAAAPRVHAALLIKNICRVKGQEENTLQGLGLVVGLKGTGDGGSYLPAIRSLARAMELMGSPLGRNGVQELKDAKNVALVMVTATVPGAGARQGDRIDCTISSIGSAKSLAGGQLFVTPLQGPQVQSPRIYAFAQGQVYLDDDRIPTTGKVHGGCRLEEDFFNAFVKDNKFTLVLEKNHADFQVAQDIAQAVNDHLTFQSLGSDIARAINQVNIEIDIPPQYANNTVEFVSQVMGVKLLEPRTEARVVINERAGTIVIDGDVEIGGVVVAHKNVTVESVPDASMQRFIPLDARQTEAAKLKGLYEALNAVKVPPDDIIEIIKQIERSGKLHGKLVIE